MLNYQRVPREQNASAENSADPLDPLVKLTRRSVLVLLFVATAHAFFLSHGEAFLELHRDDGCSIARVEYQNTRMLNEKMCSFARR
jgi:hypothetical protein